jgi:hypothetical protein
MGVGLSPTFFDAPMQGRPPEAKNGRYLIDSIGAGAQN